MGHRSSWKAPFVDRNLLKAFNKNVASGSKKGIKTRSRGSLIIPLFVKHVFFVYNGRKYIPVSVNEEMVGHKFGEFSPTRTYYGHNFDKKGGKK